VAISFGATTPSRKWQLPLRDCDAALAMTHYAKVSAMTHCEKVSAGSGRTPEGFSKG
jgi:hypothetical protein